MAGDRTYSGDPLADIPELAGELAPPDALTSQGSLVPSLTPVLDRVRMIPTRLGARRHRVYIVKIQWAGASGRRGDGRPVELSRREIVPPPRVREMDSIRRVARSTGVVEEGDLVVDRISARYTEDDLRGLTPDAQDPTQPRTRQGAVEVYWEVVEVRPSVPPPGPRRFSTPLSLSRTPSGTSWRATLVRQEGDAGRYGSLDRGAF